MEMHGTIMCNESHIELPIALPATIRFNGSYIELPYELPRTIMCNGSHEKVPIELPGTSSLARIQSYRLYVKQHAHVHIFPLLSHGFFEIEVYTGYGCLLL